MDVLPWCRRHGIPIMVYLPVEQGRILNAPALHAVASRHTATPAQVALSWLVRLDPIIAIPRAVYPNHIRENRAALDLHLTSRDLADLDETFPVPRRRQRLATL